MRVIVIVSTAVFKMPHQICEKEKKKEIMLMQTFGLPPETLLISAPFNCSSLICKSLRSCKWCIGKKNQLAK